MSMETAARLAENRKKRKMSQEELAGKLGVSRQAISKWERGETSPDTDNLIALAGIYGMTLDELLLPHEESKQPAVTDSTAVKPSVAPTAIAETTTPETVAPVPASTPTPSYASSPTPEPTPAAGAQAAVSAKVSFDDSVFAPATDVTGEDYVSVLEFEPAPTAENIVPKIETTPSASSDYISAETRSRNERPALSAAAQRVLNLAAIVISVVAFFIYGFLSMLFPSLGGAYPLICTFIYLVLGFVFNKWHPGWLIFLSIPIFFTIF